MRIALAALVLAPSIMGAAADHRWATYRNAKAGYSVCYPADLMIPARGSSNPEVEFFYAGDDAKLGVSGKNAPGPPAAELAAMLKVAGNAGDKVTYHARRDGWAVLSGITGDGYAFYQRIIVAGGREADYRLTYAADPAQRRDYDAMIRRLNACLRTR